MINTETIKCGKCGWDTGISTGPMHLYIPPPGIKCPNCNIIIIAVPGAYLKEENLNIEDILNKPKVWLGEK